MRKLTLILFTSLFSLSLPAQEKLPFKMEELTSPGFVKAVEASGGVVIIPIGIIEKHGPHLPLGSDIFESREVAFQAAAKEYSIVFPTYYTGQIFEARHQPGTIAYSNELMWKMLDETCKELSRNGLKKIVLMNGHGGNTSFLQYFCQSQLAGTRDYIVVLFQPGKNLDFEKEINSLKKAKVDGHAGEEETSMMYFIRPDLVNVSAIKSQSGANQARLKELPFGYTGIGWYARFPNHYASEAAEANRKLGELLIASDASQLAELVKYLKNNNTIEKLQEEFYRRGEDPLNKQ